MSEIKVTKVLEPLDGDYACCSEVDMVYKKDYDTLKSELEKLKADKSLGFIETSDENTKKLLSHISKLQSELSAKDEKLNKAIAGLKQADEKMRLARQTAFESMFRDILWKGTEEVVLLLSEIETKQLTKSTELQSSGKGENE